MTKPKRLVITGASGYVGQALIPLLRQAGCELLLVGRQKAVLQELFPGVLSSSYEQWQNLAEGYDAVVNLAVINNDHDAPWQTFEAINVDLPCSLAEQAAQCGIPKFVQVSSFHAMDPNNSSAYARSKRLATERLNRIHGISTTTLYLPLVWAAPWPQSLKALNRMPRPLATAVFRLLAALKPAVHVGRVATAVFQAVKTNAAEVTATDPIDDNAWYRAGTAIIDYGFAVTIVALFWWLLIGIAVWVKTSSPGPAIFAQQRIGRNGAHFTCYKFRTMKTGTKQAGTHEVAVSAVTPAGAILRRTKLDELPQVWNILKGELSLIGPRPGLPVQQELFEARQRVGVFAVKPGISGWAQIYDVDMSNPEKLAKWDSHYIAMRSLLLNIRIILATAFGRGQGDRTSDCAAK